MGLFYWVYEMGIASRSKASWQGRSRESQTQQLSLSIAVFICICFFHFVFIYPTTSAEILPDGVQSNPRTYANADPDVALFPEGPLAAGFIMLMIAATIFSRNQKEKQGLVQPDTPLPLPLPVEPMAAQQRPVSPKRNGRAKKGKHSKRSVPKSPDQLKESSASSLEKASSGTGNVDALIQAPQKVAVEVVKIHAEKPERKAEIPSHPKRHEKPQEPITAKRPDRQSEPKLAETSSPSRSQRKKRLATAKSDPTCCTSSSVPKSSKVPASIKPASSPSPVRSKHAKPSRVPELRKPAANTLPNTAAKLCKTQIMSESALVNGSHIPTREETGKVRGSSDWVYDGRENRAYSLPLQHEALRKRRGHPECFGAENHENGHSRLTSRRDKSASLYTSEYRLRPSRSESMHGRMEDDGGDQLELFSFLKRIGMEIYFGLLSSKKINFATMLAMNEYEFEISFELPLYAKRRIWKGLKEWQWTVGRRRSVDGFSLRNDGGRSSSVMLSKGRTGQCYYESKHRNGIDVNMSQLEALATGMTSAVLD